MTTTSTAAPPIHSKWGVSWLSRYLLYTLFFHVLYGTWLLLRFVPDPTLVKGDEIMGTLGGAIATGFCFIGSHSRLGPGKHTSWWGNSRVLIALALGCYTFEQVVLAYPDFTGNPIHWNYWALTAQGLLIYPLFLLGILRLPSRPMTLTFRTRVMLDVAMIITAIITFSWYFVLGPELIALHRSLHSKIVALCYPLFDLALICCLLLQNARISGGPLRRLTRLFSCGLLIAVATDSIWAYLSLHHTYSTGMLIDFAWSLGYSLMAISVSAIRSVSTRSCADTNMDGKECAEELQKMPPLWQSFLPYALLPAVGLLYLFTKANHAHPRLIMGIGVGGAILIGLVLLRQVMAILENRALNERLQALATTDPLTGLVNHRTFQIRLNEEADRALREGKPVAIVMTDLDNFKFFNDAYGHTVGDEVLREVARALASCARSYDTVARFGGDEFALLLPGQEPGSADELQAYLRERLAGVSYCPPGHQTAIPLTLAVGVALFPGDGGTRLEALETADMRLRRSKTGLDADRPAEQLCRRLAGSVAGFDMLNGLVGAVDAKDRYTRRHSEDVLIHSLSIAQELKLDEATCHHIQVAALLHDVGKIGVSDHILRKPGRLTEEEYESIRQHPRMGASIVGAVPGFEETLEAIQHHHERWDGGGYPFGLAGGETPLAARIMAVADAFSAMTTDRPYRKGMATESALQILEEGAGTQWDPECVAAFVRTQTRADRQPTQIV